MQIGELAAATGLTRDTLRFCFYEKCGLLLSRRLANGYRDYPLEAVQWLCYLRADLARELARPGFGCPVLEEQAAA